MSRKTLSVIVMMMILSIGVNAQSGNDSKGHGYLFVAPGAATNGGGSSASLHIGGGGEGLVYKGLGVGGEIGWLGPTRALNDGFGVLSANGSYHFRNATASGKVVPFVTGGWSLAFRSGSAHGGNFGGGINYWFKERIGLRLEVRDHVFNNFTSTHFLGFRVGLAFR
ncbi:MAG: hypothetical protein IPM55_07795 [Acidobacteria bacterium]|nr:hypothetical protein [Acidobacteriota bacterium]